MGGNFSVALKESISDITLKSINESLLEIDTNFDASNETYNKISVEIGTISGNCNIEINNTIDTNIKKWVANMDDITQKIADSFTSEIDKTLQTDMEQANADFNMFQFNTSVVKEDIVNNHMTDVKNLIKQTINRDIDISTNNDNSITVKIDTCKDNGHFEQNTQIRNEEMSSAVADTLSKVFTENRYNIKEITDAQTALKQDNEGINLNFIMIIVAMVLLVGGSGSTVIFRKNKNMLMVIAAILTIVGLGVLIHAMISGSITSYIFGSILILLGGGIGIWSLRKKSLQNQVQSEST